ncbi:hypothetical protein TSUD_308350 [Trifolium subterraneum]|nr:hypothetical protein TSUD_308350 [Trifolium subterraneum]
MRSTRSSSTAKPKTPSRKNLNFPKYGCFRIQHDDTGEGGYDIQVVDASGHTSNPTHLIIMVNGLIGSAYNWKYAAKHFLKRYPYDTIVDCKFPSTC